MERDIRFKDAPWFEEAKKQEILVIGAGGIGSNFTYLASRAGYNITIQDDDTVELHNIASQFFTSNDVGSPKVIATSNHTFNFAGKSLRTMNTRFVESSMIAPITIVCVDNMTTRHLAFKKWREIDERELLIEGRFN